MFSSRAFASVPAVLRSTAPTVLLNLNVVMRPSPSFVIVFLMMMLIGLAAMLPLSFLLSLSPIHRLAIQPSRM
jgi:hypothetical protein